jgi:hypothetical protein
VARPASEHVLVEGYCEPIFSAEEADELRSLGLDPVRLRALTDAAEGRFAADAGPLFERRAALAREAERLTSRDETLLELVEDRLIDKEEFARRRGRLAEERAAAAAELRALEAALRARADTAVDLGGTLSGLARMSDVYDELDEVGDRRRLLEACLGRLIVDDGFVEIHLPASSDIVVRLEPNEGGPPPSATSAPQTSSASTPHAPMLRHLPPPSEHPSLGPKQAR